MGRLVLIISVSGYISVSFKKKNLHVSLEFDDHNVSLFSFCCSASEAGIGKR